MIADAGTKTKKSLFVEYNMARVAVLIEQDFWKSLRFGSRIDTNRTVSGRTALNAVTCDEKRTVLVNS